MGITKIAIVAAIMIIALASPSFAEPNEIIDSEVFTSVFIDKVDKVFRIGIVVSEGIYFEPSGDEYIVSELPLSCGKGVVLAETRMGTGVNDDLYYFVQGSGWEGWVNSRYFAVTDLTGEINTPQLNVRREPNAKSEIARKVVKGDPVRLYERTTQEETIGEDTGYWYRIRMNEWVFGPYVDLNANTDLLRIFQNDNENNPLPVDAVITIADGVLASTDRKFHRSEKPTGAIEAIDATLHSQALYWGCQVLDEEIDKSTDKEKMLTMLDWARRLRSDFSGITVYDREFSFGRSAAGESVLFVENSYIYLDDVINLQEHLVTTFAEIGDTSYIGIKYGSLYGLEMINTLWRKGDAVGNVKRAEIFGAMYDVAPSRKLAAAALLYQGKALLSSGYRKAEGQHLLMRLINEYPDEEHRYYSITTHFGQEGLLEYIKSLSNDAKRREFLLSYSRDDTPFPIRYLALHLLAYGDAGYDDVTTFSTLDESFRELVDSINIPNKRYWFSTY